MDKRYRILDTIHTLQDIRYMKQDTILKKQDIKHTVQNTRYKIQKIGNKILDMIEISRLQKIQNRYPYTG